MLRFYNGKIYEVLYEKLDKRVLEEILGNGDSDKILCIKDEDGRYVGNITSEAVCLDEDIEKIINRSTVIFDQNIWEKGRNLGKGQTKNKYTISIFAVVNERNEFMFFAYQDDDANRELRMLRELQEEDTLNFRDVFPDYDCVEIYGINELAFRFAEYLNYCGIPVRVHGKAWEMLGGINCTDSIAGISYVIYADGIWQKSSSLYNESMRSVSVCFDCIDKIYEANIKAGRIEKTLGEEKDLIEYIRHKAVVIIGTDTAAVDTYDYLLGKGVQVSFFVEKCPSIGSRYIFGKPLLSFNELFAYDRHFIILECHGTDSRWGTNGTDFFEYYGYERNKQFFFVRDYFIPLYSGLGNVVKRSESIVMFGLASMCEYLKNQDVFLNKEVEYIDLLGEKDGQDYCNECVESDREILFLFVYPELLYEDSEIYQQRIDSYISKASLAGINNYSDYFAHSSSYIAFESDYNIEKQLRPQGIMLGAIDGNSGNILFNGILDEHPNIIKMDSCYLKDNLFSICVRLSQKKSSDIMSAFWEFYEKEANSEKEKFFSLIKTKFDYEMKQILRKKDYYTSQELFMAFHLGYVFATGKDIFDLGEMIVYWESHYSSRDQMEKYAYWLKDENVSGYIINMTRNSCMRAGSYFATCDRFADILDKKTAYFDMLQAPSVRKEIIDGYQRIILSFEEIKIKPKDITKKLCEKLDIPWSEKMLHVTNHGNESVTRHGIRGFDLKPVFNQYDEYFSGYDRMRIMWLTSPWQKAYGYPYIDCREFSRCVLQEWILDDFRFEKMIQFSSRKEEKGYKIRKREWLRERMQIIYREMQEETEICVERETTHV